jgi:hypothetical protein
VKEECKRRSRHAEELAAIRNKVEVRVNDELQSPFNVARLQSEVGFEQKKTERGIKKAEKRDEAAATKAQAEAAATKAQVKPPRNSRKKQNATEPAVSAEVSSAQPEQPLVPVTTILLLMLRPEVRLDPLAPAGKAQKKQPKPKLYLYSLTLWEDGPNVDAVSVFKRTPFIVNEYTTAYDRGSAPSTMCQYCLNFNQKYFASEEEQKTHKSWHNKYRHYHDVREQAFPQITNRMDTSFWSEEYEKMVLATLTHLWRDCDPDAPWFSHRSYVPISVETLKEMREVAEAAAVAKRAAVTAALVAKGAEQHVGGGRRIPRVYV